MPKAAMPHRIEGALRELPHYLIGQCIENWLSIGKVLRHVGVCVCVGLDAALVMCN